MRKIIQMVALDDKGDDDNVSLLAVCDDGTVWYYEDEDMSWHPFPNVPQHKLKEAVG